MKKKKKNMFVKDLRETFSVDEGRMRETYKNDKVFKKTVSALLMLPVFLYATTTTRLDGGTSCNIYWANWDNVTDNTTDSDRQSILNEQTAFTFYSLIFGFLGPLAFILIFYVLGKN